jgi:hypothetical protein
VLFLFLADEEYLAMKRYYIFIDESGTFSFKKGRSYVGGWVCRQGDLNKVVAKLENCVKRFNKYLVTQKQTYSLRFPDHLHFMPLHRKEFRTGKDQQILLEPRHTPELFHNIFKDIQENTLLVFRSSGKPAIIPNEQAAYIDTLRNTLLQLLEEPFFTDGSRARIFIAHRRMKNLYGQDGIEHFRDYEKYIADRISAELKESFPGKDISLRIDFDDARKEPGLILADCFCGAQRWGRENYLENYSNCKIYPFARGFLRVGGRQIQKLQFLDEIDSVSAAVQCCEILSSNPNDREADSLLQGIFKKLDKRQKVNFFELMIEYMDELLVSNPDRYASLDGIENVIGVLRNKLDPDPEKLSHSELRLLTALQLNELRIKSHRGQTSGGLLEKYLKFLNKYGELAFENLIQLTQERIEAVLMGVQMDAFNTLQLDRVESILKKVRDDYVKMFKDRLSQPNVIDNNYARLEGTLGQMYAFQYDLTGDEDFFEFSKEYLKRDVAACLPATPCWEQGMGYLTVLYWKKGKLEKGCSNFIAESLDKDSKTDLIYDLGKLEHFNCVSKPFLFLHRLNLCALAHCQGQKIRNIEKAAAFLLEIGGIENYPQVLSAKWLAILFAMNGDFDSALNLLEKAILPENNGGFTVQLIQLPLKLCRHLCMKAVNKRSNFSIKDEIKRLEALQKGSEEILIRLGVEKYYGEIGLSSIYDIGAILPFYYS